MTLAGTRRRIDVVLAGDHTVAALVPDALRLLEEPVSDPPAAWQLLLTDGTALAPERTLLDAAIADGTLLRLVSATEAPPPPVVLDVTEELADALEVQSLRWGAPVRRLLQAAVAGAASALAIVIATHGLAHHTATVLVDAVAAALLIAGLAAGVAGGGKNAKARREPLQALATALTLCATGAGSAGCWTLLTPWTTAAGAQCAIAALALTALGVGSRLGRAGIAAGLLGLLMVGACAALLAVTTVPRTAAVVTVLGAFGIGQLPRLALLGTGLGGLDDRRTHGGQVRRVELNAAVYQAHRTLALSTIVLALAAAAAGVVLAHAAASWTVPLAGVSALLLMLRARAFPLALEVAALVGGSVTVMGALLLTWGDRADSGPAAAAIAAGVVALLAAAATLGAPSEPVRARLRWAADRAEVVAVLATVPLAVGTFGLFGHLLGSFS